MHLRHQIVLYFFCKEKKIDIKNLGDSIQGGTPLELLKKVEEKNDWWNDTDLNFLSLLYNFIK